MLCLYSISVTSSVPWPVLVSALQQGVKKLQGPGRSYGSCSRSENLPQREIKEVSLCILSKRGLNNHLFVVPMYLCVEVFCKKE